jgi:hypothetical protein
MPCEFGRHKNLSFLFEVLCENLPNAGVLPMQAEINIVAYFCTTINGKNP